MCFSASQRYHHECLGCESLSAKVTPEAPYQKRYDELLLKVPRLLPYNAPFPILKGIDGHAISLYRGSRPGSPAFSHSSGWNFFTGYALPVVKATALVEINKICIVILAGGKMVGQNPAWKGKKR